MSNLEESNDDVPFFSFAGQEISAKIVDVYDADSARAVIERNGELQKFSIRLSGIDTPEKRSRNPTERRAAKAALARLLEILGVESECVMRKKVRSACARCRTLVRLRCGAFDKYGRLLCDIIVGDDRGGERSANEELVRMGVAKRYDGGRKAGWSEEELLAMLGENGL